MAEEAVDEAVKVFGLKPNSGCVTKEVKLVGSDGWSPNMYIKLVQSFGVETEVAQHLAADYGDRAWTVLSYASPTGLRWPLQGVRLNNSYPYIEAEVHYATQHEYAQTAIDFIARRSRLSFLNAGTALDVLPRVIQLMGDDLHWSTARRREEWVKAREFLVSMGLPPSTDVQEELKGVKGKLGDAGPVRNWARWWLSPWHWAKSISGAAAATVPLGPSTSHRSRGLFSIEDLERVKKAFANAETTISRDDVVALMKEMDFGVPGVELDSVWVDNALSNVGVRKDERIGFEQFWQVCVELKTSAVAPSIQATISKPRNRIPVTKSGGGV
ncbi:mitochondrial glycerol-3-phosphate dehydrogenase [Tulasnella sp. 427]|nr:mitochondrial glycerol-3-phosphate dehydrogenase [Tulasnella sp. 427]